MRVTQSELGTIMEGINRRLDELLRNPSTHHHDRIEAIRARSKDPEKAVNDYLRIEMANIRRRGAMSVKLDEAPGTAF